MLEKSLASTERDLSSRIEQARQQLSSRTRELDQLRAESGGRSERLTANHAKELNQEREKALKVGFFSRIFCPLFFDFFFQ